MRLPSPAVVTAAVVAVGMGAATAFTLRPRRREARPSLPGRKKRMGTRLLETGSSLLQETRPLDDFDVYLVGFHPMKDDPDSQMEAHHFCRQVNEDFMECVLFDGGDEEASLIGVEYIISEDLFETLPADERPYWHPHNGEIISGQLVAPGLPEAAEHALMRSKMNSYGKTWHLWQAGETLPRGEPKLMWSFSRLGEARDELIRLRDERLRVDTEERRRARQDLVALAHPQEGVDALKGRFAGPTTDIPGVRDKAAETAATRLP